MDNTLNPDKLNIVFLPGWGFKAEIFSISSFQNNIVSELNKYLNTELSIETNIGLNSDLSTNHHASTNCYNYYAVDLPSIELFKIELFKDEINDKINDENKDKDKDKYKVANTISDNALNINTYHENILDILANELNKKIPENAIVVGWSLGGLIAIYLAHKFPAKFKQLVTICATPKFVAADNWSGIPKDVASKFYSDAKFNLSNLMRKFHLMVAHPLKDSQTMQFIKDNALNINKNQESLLFYLKMLLEFDLRYYYQCLKLPMLHILGAKDTILPHTTAYNFMELNQTAKIKIMPDAGHLCFF